MTEVDPLADWVATWHTRAIEFAGDDPATHTPSQGCTCHPHQFRTSERFWFIRIRADWRPFAGERGFDAWRAWSVEHDAGVESLTAHAQYEGLIQAALADLGHGSAVIRGDATFLTPGPDGPRTTQPRRRASAGPVYDIETAAQRYMKLPPRALAIPWDPVRR